MLKKNHNTSNPAGNSIYTVSFFLIILYFFYLLDVANLIELSSQVMVMAIILFTGASSIIGVAIINRYNIRRVCYSDQLFKVFLAVGFAVVMRQFFDFPEIWMNGDELFRLANARGIVHQGIPLPNDWFMAGASSVSHYYLFLEWLAAIIYISSFKLSPLEFIYIDLFPLVIRVATAYFCFDLIDRLNILNRVEIKWHVRYFQYIFGAGVLLLGASPYWMANYHTLERQPLFSWMIILLTAVLIFDLITQFKNKGSKRRIFFQSLLCWTLPAIVVGTKLLFSTVLLGAVGIAYGGILIGYRSRSIVHFAPPFIGVFIYILSYLVMKFDTPSGEFIFGFRPWSTFDAHGYVGGLMLHGVIENTWIGLIVSLGVLNVALTFMYLKRYISRNSLLMPYWLLFIFGLLFTGYILGLFVQHTGDTGGAENYWLLAGWFGGSLLALNAVVYLSKERLLFSSVLVIYFLSSMSLSAYLIKDSKYTYRYLEGNIRAAKSICGQIDTWLSDESSRRGKYYVIAHPWQGQINYEVLAYCPISSVVTDSKYGGKNRLDGFEQSMSVNNMLISSNEIDNKALAEYKKDNEIDGVFVIRHLNDKLNSVFDNNELFQYLDASVPLNEVDYVLYGPI